ncbi:MAG: tryptophan--tRNA ligase [Cytophagaceae bacterium]|nr:tryptophan--tRNA ligase [Cytophagaceae bacterium]
MARILTGIQSSGRPHLGNILGAILPAIELSKKDGNDCFFFIADLHTLTSAAWMAFGFDTSKNTFYRQSDVPEVCELAWYLSCYFPYQRLTLAHSFKDKSEKLAEINTGLFTYPMLMAADILMYDAQIVPVGKDQLQHLEFTRDVAGRFNHQYGETFVLPEARIDEKVMVVPGIDGEKMSKSYNNYIDIFLPEPELKKKVMSIVTDSLPLEAPKDAEQCNVYKLFQLVAEAHEAATMRQKYAQGGYGYGHAKKELLEKLLTKYSQERERFNYYMNHLPELDLALKAGAEKARQTGQVVLHRVREKLGF